MELNDEKFSQLVRLEIRDVLIESDIDILRQDYQRWEDELARYLIQVEQEILRRTERYSGERERILRIKNHKRMLRSLEASFGEEIGVFERRAMRIRVRLDKVSRVNAVANGIDRGIAFDFLVEAIRAHKLAKPNGDEYDEKLWGALDGQWLFDGTESL